MLEILDLFHGFLKVKILSSFDAMFSNKPLNVLGFLFVIILAFLAAYCAVTRCFASILGSGYICCSGSRYSGISSSLWHYLNMGPALFCYDPFFIFTPFTNPKFRKQKFRDWAPKSDSDYDSDCSDAPEFKLRQVRP